MVSAAIRLLLGPWVLCPLSPPRHPPLFKGFLHDYSDGYTMLNLRQMIGRIKRVNHPERLSPVLRGQEDDLAAENPSDAHADLAQQQSPLSQGPYSFTSSPSSRHPLNPRTVMKRKRRR